MNLNRIVQILISALTFGAAAMAADQVSSKTQILNEMLTLPAFVSWDTRVLLGSAKSIIASDSRITGRDKKRIARRDNQRCRRRRQR